MTDKPVTDGHKLRRPTLFLTNLIKLVGLAIAVNEALLQPETRPSVLALAAFMMAGAQISEDILMAFIDSFLGRRNGSGLEKRDGRNGLER